MKRTILMIVGVAIAIMGSAHAQQYNPLAQQYNPVSGYPIPLAQQIARSLNAMTQRAAQEAALAAPQFEENQLHCERLTAQQADLARACAEQARHHDIQNGTISSASIDCFDDDATIVVYLHDAGYPNLSTEELAKVKSYMHAHGIRHVSELGQ